MAAGQVDAPDKKSSMLSLDVEPVTATYEGFCKLVEHQLDATLGTNPHNIAPVGVGPPLINEAFRTNMTKMLGTIIVTLQYQHPQQQHLGSTHSVHTGRREKYNNDALAAVMGYTNVFNTNGMPRIWGKFKKYKGLADNRQELKKGMECWSRMKRITIEKAIFFIKFTIEDIINISFTTGVSVDVF